MRKIIIVTAIIAILVIAVGCQEKLAAPAPTPETQPTVTPQEPVQPAPQPPVVAQTPPTQAEAPPATAQATGVDISDDDLNMGEGPTETDISALTEPTPDTTS